MIIFRLFGLEVTIKEVKTIKRKIPDKAENFSFKDYAFYYTAGENSSTYIALPTYESATIKSITPMYVNIDGKDIQVSDREIILELLL